MENEKKEWLDGIASEMSDLELDERKEAFDYFSEQQARVKNWGRQYWNPNGNRNLLRNVKKEYVNELERIKKERNSSSQMILSKNVQISLYNGEINNNMLVMAGSGRGKTYSLVLPNAAQANASYVFSDPKGDVLRRIGTHLTEQLYKIKVLNLIDMAQSNSYNPFHYLNKEHEEDVMTL
jgi:Type IV secretory pathway, VirD4 components